jgi:hypothetical protein
MSEFTHDDGTVRQDYYGEGEQPWDIAKRLGFAAQFAAVSALKYVRRTKGETAKDHAKAVWYYRELCALATEGLPYQWRHDAKVVLRKLESELTANEIDICRGGEG